MSDPLARYRLTAGDLAERDLLVVGTVLHADAIGGILTKFDRC